MIAQAFLRLTNYFKIAYSISFRLDFNALDDFYSGIIVYLYKIKQKLRYSCINSDYVLHSLQMKSSISYFKN